MANLRSLMKIGASVVFALCPGLLTAQTRSVVVVGVSDESTGAPLTEARVRIVDLGRAATTNWIGEAVLPGIPAGQHAVEARQLGYRPSNVTVLVKGDSVSVVFRMMRVTPSLDTVVVRGVPVPLYLEEFERRRAGLLGRFLVAAQLDSVWNESVADIAATRFPGLRAYRNSSRTAVWLLSSHSTTSLQHPTCAPAIFVDRVYRDSEVLVELTAGQIAGVEYYSIAPPVQYTRPGLGCGSILIWTKR